MGERMGGEEVVKWPIARLLPQRRELEEEKDLPKLSLPFLFSLLSLIESIRWASFRKDSIWPFKCEFLLSLNIKCR